MAMFRNQPSPIMLRRHFLALLSALAAPAVRAATSPWPLLEQGGYVILMRHAATVPGVGDPPGFKLGECATQRNLSDTGRKDAARIGAAFRAHNVRVAEVLSSRWCRCVDTAQLAFGRAQAAPMLDSMFRDDDVARQSKLAALRSYVASLKGRDNVVLVTHDVNIRALVGEYVEQGTFIVASRTAKGELRIASVVPVDSLGG